MTKTATSTGTIDEKSLSTNPSSTKIDNPEYTYTSK